MAGTLAQSLIAKMLKILALPRGLRQPNKPKHLAESGTPKPFTGSFGFLPRVSHQDTTRESKSPDCASTLTLIITPALRGVGRCQAYLDGELRPVPTNLLANWRRISAGTSAVAIL